MRLCLDYFSVQFFFYKEVAVSRVCFDINILLLCFGLYQLLYLNENPNYHYHHLHFHLPNDDNEWVR